MSQTNYVVALYNRRWTVLLNGYVVGPYPSQAAAVRAAIAAARENGPGSEVLIRSEDDDRTVWRHGGAEPLMQSA
jgi:hypothetical protein